MIHIEGWIIDFNFASHCPMTTSIVVGVLALQGAFHEHLALLRVAVKQVASDACTAWDFFEVRTPQDLAKCDALIVPGGESTTVALVAARSGLLEPLRDFVKYVFEDAPLIWGYY